MIVNVTVKVKSIALYSHCRTHEAKDARTIIRMHDCTVLP
jgi:hypothetical protein